MHELQKHEDTESPSLRPDRIQAFLHLLLGVLFFMGTLLICGALAIFCCSLMNYGEFRGFGQVTELLEDLKEQAIFLNIFVFLSSTLPLILAAFLTMRFVQANSREYLLLYLPQQWNWFFWSILFVAVSIPLMGLMLEINNLIDFSQWEEMNQWLLQKEADNNQMYESLIGDRSPISLFMSLLFMALLPAIAEEIFFRGFLMNILNGIFKNMHLAILATAFIFSAMHLQFMKFLPMFFLACVFGYATYWSGSLLTSIVAHFINNAFAVIQLFYFSDGEYEKSLEQSQSFGPVTNFVLVVAVLALFIFIHRSSTNKTPRFYV